jgi:hypothetical protein
MNTEERIEKYLGEEKGKRDRINIPSKRGPVHISKGASAEEIIKSLGISKEDREAAKRIIKKFKERGLFK